MDPELRLVIQLQDLDNRIREAQREVASLPKHIAAIEKALDSHIRKLDADRAALAANVRERKQLELEIQGQEQRISKLRDQMLAAKTNEQYNAFRNEIEFCEKEVRKFEDRILDRMGESEPLEQNVKKAEGALATEKKQVEAEKGAARERTAADEKLLAELKKKREEAVRSLAPNTYSTYERIRKKWKGHAVAEVVEGRCTACHMTLRLQFFQELRRGDQVMLCESCGRIVYYNPPVEFDELGPSSQPESQHLEA